MIFYPSEIARLVLGYLHEQQCWVAAEIFLKESPHLEEHRKLIKTGHFHPLVVNGKNLIGYLNEIDYEEDSSGGKGKSHRSGSSKSIVHEAVQTDSLFLTHDDEEVQMVEDESNAEELVHEVFLSPNKKYTICPFEATSPESFAEKPSVLSLKITDSFIISEELFNNQTFQYIDKKICGAVQRRKRLAPKKKLTDSLVREKLEYYEKYYTLDLLQKVKLFLDQLLCGHPVVQKITSTINRVKQNQLREDKNMPTSNKDSMCIEEIIRKTVAEVESNVFVHKYFDFLCYKRDSYVSFKKSRCLNSDKPQELSTVSSEAHETSSLNLKEYAAEDSTVMPLEITPDTISVTNDIAGPHLTNLHSNKIKADNNMSAIENIILVALLFANINESTFAADNSCDIQNFEYEKSRIPSDANASNDMNEIHSDDQPDDHSLSLHSHQTVSSVVEEGTTSESEVMMPAEMLERQNIDLKQSRLISEKADNIQFTNVQSSTLMHLSLDVANDDSISVARDSSNIQNSADETPEGPSQLDANNKITLNDTNEIFSDHSLSTHSQQNISDVIIQENTSKASKSEVMVPSKLLEKQKSKQPISEKMDNIESVHIQSSTVIDLSSDVKNIIESVSRDSSDAQHSAHETTTFPSEMDSNSMSETLSDDQTDVISLPLHFQQKINDIVMKDIINTNLESEVIMPLESLNTENSPQQSLLIPKESCDVGPPNFSNSTSRYPPVTTMFQNNDFSEPLNPFITPKFPSAGLNSKFMPSSSSMYFIQDNFLYQVIIGPDVNSPTLNSNLFETSSSINNGAQSILNLPAPRSNLSSLASSSDAIFPVSSSCSMTSMTSVLASSSNNSITPNFSSNFSTDVLSNVQPTSLSNTSLTVSNNVLSGSSNGIILPAHFGKNNLPLLTNFANGPLCSTTQRSGVLSDAQPTSLSNILPSVPNNVLALPSNSIILPPPSGTNNLPLLTNINNVPLCSSTQLSTGNFCIPAMDNGSITQIPINPPQATGIVGTLQDVELVIADDTKNRENENTGPLPDIGDPIASESNVKSNKAEGKNKNKKGNNKKLPINNRKRLSGSETSLQKKKQRQRPTRKEVRQPLYPLHPNLENYATLGLVEPVLPCKEHNLSISSNQECPTVTNVTKNPSSEDEILNDRTQLLCSSKTYLRCGTSFSNSTVKNNCNENDPHSIQLDSESNNLFLKNKNSICTTTELHEKRHVNLDNLNCTNSDINTANDEMAMPLVCCVDSTTLNNTCSDVNSVHNETTVPLECLTSSSASISTNSSVDIANDKTTNLKCVTNSNLLTGTESHTTSILKLCCNLIIPKNTNSDIDEACQKTAALSSSKYCAQFSNAAFNYPLKHEIDEEDIPLSELKNKKCLEQFSQLQVSSIRECVELSTSSTLNEEDTPLSELKNKICLEQSSLFKVSSSSNCFQVSNSSAINEEDLPLSELRNVKYLEQSSQFKVSSIKNCDEVLNSIEANEEDIPIPEFQNSKVHDEKSFKKLKELSSSKKAHGKFAHTNAFDSCSISEELYQGSNILGDNRNRISEANNSEGSPVSTRYSSILNSFLFSPKKCTNKKVPLQVKNPCAISSVPEHLSSTSDGSHPEAGYLPLCSSVISVLKDASKLENNINPVSSDDFQSNDSSIEILDSKHMFLSQTDNDWSKKTKDSHPISRKYENIGDSDQNSRSSKSKQKKNSSQETSKRKLSKLSIKEKEETSHSNLPKLMIDDNLSQEVSSNFSAELENLCTIPLSLPKNLSSSCGETLAAGDSSMSLLLQDPTKVQNSPYSITTEPLQSEVSSTVTLGDTFLPPAHNGYIKQGNDLNQIIRLSKSKKRKSSSKEISKRKISKNFTKQKEEIHHPDLVIPKTDGKPSVEISFNFPAETENVCKVSSSLPEHLNNTCGEALKADSSLLVIPSFKDASKLQDNVNPVSSDDCQGNGSSVEILDNKRTFLSQTDNDYFKKTNGCHPVSRKCENVDDLDKNTKLPKSKRNTNSSRGTSRRKLSKISIRQKEETPHPDLVSIKTDGKPSMKISFPVERDNLCKISSLSEHMSSACDGTLQTDDSSLLVVSSLKDASKLQNNINPVSSDTFQDDGSSVEKLDNKQAALSQKGNDCSKQANDSVALSRKHAIIGNSYQNIKSSETNRRKNSSNKALERKLPKRSAKHLKTSHSDLSILKTNGKANMEISNSLAETENLQVISSLSEHLISCVETQPSNNSSSAHLFYKDDAHFQNTLHPANAEPLHSDNSPPERLNNTSALLNLTDNSCLKQTNDCLSMSRKSETICNLDQNIKSSKRKRKISPKKTSKGRLPKKLTKQEKESSSLELTKLENKEENPSDFSVEMNNLSSVPCLKTHLSSSCDETPAVVKNLSVPLVVKAPTELQNNLTLVTSDVVASDDSSAETLDNIRAFLFRSDINDNSGFSKKSEAISEEAGNQNIGSSETKTLRKHSRKQSTPKKVTSQKKIKHKQKTQSAQKTTNPKCKVTKTKNSAMQQAYQTQSFETLTFRSRIEEIKGLKETSEKDLLKCIGTKNKNSTQYTSDIKRLQKMHKAKKQNDCKLSSKKQKSVNAKLIKSNKESLCLKEKINTKSFGCLNDLKNLNAVNDQNNLSLCEITPCSDKIVTLDTKHKEMALFPLKKRMVFDFLKHEYLECFNNFFQKVLLLIRYTKDIDQFYFEIKKILLFKFISQKSEKDDLLEKYLDGKIHIENMKVNSTKLESALNTEDSDKSPSIDILKEFCHKIITIQQRFKRRFKFGAKMHQEKVQIQKKEITKYVDLHLLYLELHSIRESLIKKSLISKEKIYSFEDPAFSLGSGLFSEQPIVLLERLNIPSVLRNITDFTEPQSCEQNSKNFKQSVFIKNLVSSSLTESKKQFSISLLDIKRSALKKSSGLTIMSSLISFIHGNVWPDEFKNKIISIFEMTMDIALLVNNVLYNVCEYSCDISKLVLGNNLSRQNVPHSLLVDSSGKRKKQSHSLDRFSLLDENMVSPAEDLPNKNGAHQHYSPSKRHRDSLENLSFTKQISKAFGDLKDPVVDNSQNSLRMHEISDLQNEIGSFCIAKSEAERKCSKSIENSDLNPQQDSYIIENKSDVHRKTSKEGKLNNKEISDLKICRKSKRLNELNPSNFKKEQNSKVTKEKKFNTCKESGSLNSLPDANILPKSKHLNGCTYPINVDKKCYLTSQEAVDSESFDTMSESLSESLNDSSSNTFIYWPHSADPEHIGFEIKESTKPEESCTKSKEICNTNSEELSTKSKETCAEAKKSIEQTKMLENSKTEITCINLDEGECNFNDKIPLTSINDQCEKPTLNSFKKNKTPVITETDSETNIDMLNDPTEADNSQNSSQKSCIPSSKYSKSKNQSSPGKSSSSLLQMEEAGESSSSNLSSEIFFNPIELLAALGEKSITEKNIKNAEIVTNAILEFGIEGFSKFLIPTS